jgi:predicted alpha/beta-hydrolase family hydrolase
MSILAGARAVLPTVREAADGLPSHTVYRPADLTAERSLPVIVYGNGACARSNLEGIAFLTGLASQGYVVVARGAVDEFPVPSTPATAVAHPEELLAAAEWATRSPQARVQLAGRVDDTRIGALGHSCGGIEALAAGTDPRISAVAGFNTGYFPEPHFGGYGRDRLAGLHTPTLIVNGGPDDIAYRNSIATYELLDVPAALVSCPAASHTGLIAGLQATEGWQLAADWFDFVLRGDRAAGERFGGAGHGLPVADGWAVESKGLLL